VILLEKLKLDDPVDVIPVHGFAGAWGTLALAFLADSDRLGTGLTSFEQFGVQALGVGVAFVWAFSLGYAIVWLVSKWLPIKATPEQELLGLNMVEHNARTDVLDLLTEMEGQRRSGDFSKKLSVEPFTQVGQIAQQYNRVLDKVNEASRDAQHKTEVSKLALREAEEAKQELSDKVADLSTFNRFANQREHRMLELKAEINNLCAELGQEPKYDLSEIRESNVNTSGEQ
jgi:Amt family ammonium transporter